MTLFDALQNAVGVWSFHTTKIKKKSRKMLNFWANGTLKNKHNFKYLEYLK